MTFTLDALQGAQIHRNWSTAALYEEAVRAGEGAIAEGGALACVTGQHTGRSANDKFIVREPSSEQDIAWEGTNRAMSEAHFDTLERDMVASVAGKTLYLQDCYAGADAAHRLPVRVVTERAWHSLFARNLLMFDPERGAAVAPPLTIIDLPSFRADPERHGTRTGVVIALNFARRLVLIGGTSYAGEIKKAVFTVLNYRLPLAGVLPMHCSANVGPACDTTLFFGLSGTGKTTLSSDPERSLVGDDEHGWSDRGVFNFEGGCYAKTVRLSRQAEPEIYAATERFGTVLENVVLDAATRRPQFDDDSLTENTRAAYPIGLIRNAIPSGQAAHPRNIVMLTADAFGVLPPIARLSPDAAMYHFLSGYTAKVAGTEKGVTEPTATFSSCFGAPFLPLAPGRYAGMFGDRIKAHHVNVWLVNTGWTGGRYGIGKRFEIAHTRGVIRAALSGALDAVAYRRDPLFNMDVPEECTGVPRGLLTPRSTWRHATEFDRQAALLAQMFTDNFKRYAGQVADSVLRAGPAPA